jgi:hypothetical protein
LRRLSDEASTELDASHSLTARETIKVRIECLRVTFIFLSAHFNAKMHSILLCRNTSLTFNKKWL